MFDVFCLKVTRDHIDMITWLTWICVFVPLIVLLFSILPSFADSMGFDLEPFWLLQQKSEAILATMIHTQLVWYC